MTITKTNKTKHDQAEVSAASMSVVMMRLLEQAPNGFVTQAELEAAIVASLGHEFTAVDSRLMKVGRTGTVRQKWRNNLDWAKALATKQGLIATRRRGKTTYIVLIGKTPDHLAVQRWAIGKRTRNSMKKRCGKCRKYSPLAADCCQSCGNNFPAPTAKRFATAK